MGFQYQLIFAFLSLTMAVSHAALSPQDYWKSVLPNTPIPKAIKDILPPTVGVKKNRMSIDLGKLGAKIGSEKGQLDQVHDNGIISAGFHNYGQVSTSDTPFHFDPKETMYFFEENLKQGAKMNLLLIKTTNKATFLPRQLAQSIPFSSKKIPQILTQFSVQPNSVKAQIIEETVKACEQSGVKGEKKYCTTSLESMVDFCTSVIGKNVQAISAELAKQSELQEYEITGVQKIGGGEEKIACHKLNYPFAVFYCHKLPFTKAYVVSLEGGDGTTTKSLGICHEDTSTWNPKHLSFQLLKVKPGTVPVCHFLQEDTVVWVGN